MACRSRNRPCVYDSGQRRQRPSAALISSLQNEKSALEEVLSQLKSASDDQRHALLESVKIRNGSVSLSPRARSSFSTVPQNALSICETQHYPQPALLQRENSHHAQVVPMTSDDGAPQKQNPHDDIEYDFDDGDEPGVSSEEDGIGDDFHQTETVRENELPSDNIYSSTSVIPVSSPGSAIRPDTPGHVQSAVSMQVLRTQLFANAAMERQREHQLRHLKTIRGVPAELALHLLDLHWSRQHHTFLLTYRPAFTRELEHGGPYCTDLLLNAVFACSSKFSERVDVRSDPDNPETAGRHFYDRCDDLLLHGGLLSQSRIPTIIALVMLGSTFNARGLTSKGWLYTGYALRMVYDLELHLDSVAVNAHNVEEVEIRRRVFWGAFICEKLQSLYLGRPPTIRLRDAHVSLDFLDTFEELEVWEPDPDLRARGSSAGVPSTPTSTVAPTASTYTYSVTVFQQLCLLSKIMIRIMNKIYFVGATARKTLNEIRPLDNDLIAWYRNLPKHLVFEPWAKGSKDPSVMVAPNRVVLLTTYHSLVILLHRPFIAGSASTNAAPDGTGYAHSRRPSAESWKRCATAARNITSLVLSYRSVYPLRRSSYLLSYAVYVACTIHVLNAASLSSGSGNNAYAESSLLLSTSLRCLDELAVPNSGVADTASIIRKLMAAKGVHESPTPSLAHISATHPGLDNVWQNFNASPTYDDFAQMEPFQDIGMPGQDLLVGFMNENVSFADLGMGGVSF